MSTHALKAMTFGSAMVDIIVVLNSNSVEKLTLSNAQSQFLLIEPGQKLEARSITTHIGGGALNTGISFSRLGCDVLPIVKTGKDASKDHVTGHCTENGLSVEGIITTDEEPTGSAVMIASHERNAAIFTQRGANTTLNSEDVRNVTFAGFDIVHIAPLSGNSALCLPQIAKCAKEAGCFLSSNPGIRQISKHPNTVLSAARSMDLISINDTEAAALATCLSAQLPDLVWQDAKDDDTILPITGGNISLQQFCQVMHENGTQNILITFGKDGAFLYDGSGLHHQPIIKTNVASTAGAGDAFVSTLVFGLKSGLGSKTALSMAAHNSSSVVSHVNTTDGLLQYDDLLAKAGQ